MATIREKYKMLCAVIAKTEREITALQKKCKHPKATEKCGANIGNYDPTADCYWIDTHCADCGYSHTVFKDSQGWVTNP